MSIEDLIAKYGCRDGTEDAEDDTEESDSEDVEDEGKTSVFMLLGPVDFVVEILHSMKLLQNTGFSLDLGILFLAS
jgi:hypothetical protein